MTKTELFIKLATPNKEGESRWVRATEFIGEYKDLQLGNGVVGVEQTRHYPKNT